MARMEKQRDKAARRLQRKLNPTPPDSETSESDTPELETPDVESSELETPETEEQERLP